MQRFYDSDLKGSVTLDDDKRVRAITYVDNFPKVQRGPETGSTKSFIRSMAANLGIELEQLSNLDQVASFLDPKDQGIQYRLSDEKTFFDTTTLVYRQTYMNTPVWSAGLTVTLKPESDEVLAVTNTSAVGIDAKLPAKKDLDRYRTLFATAEKADGNAPEKRSKDTKAAPASSKALADLFAGALRKSYDSKKLTPGLIRGGFQIYWYDARKRLGDHPDHSSEPSQQTPADSEPGKLPTLPLAAVPKSIEDGSWRMVSELIVRLPVEDIRLNWRMLVDVKTNAILYLRALAAGVNGLVFTYDPISSTGDPNNDATQSNAVLNPLRDDVVLQGLAPPTAGMQSLTGDLVAVSEVELPTIAAPTRPAGTDFDYDVRTNAFAAVNAYYHNDRFFRLVEDLGFPLSDYFDGTSFPVEIDHRGIGGANNAHCIGDGDGIDHACYGLIDSSAGPVSNACEWSVILHELGGHGILYDHVNSANFGFSHSAGDSFAIILNDFISEWHNGAAIDRFIRSPFRQNLRRSDRAVADGWGWGGPKDDGSYQSEQILSTTMFRVYRSIGGDSPLFTRREFSARLMAYLMLRAVGTLSPVSNPNSPAQFLDALLTADAGDWTTEGLFGGAYEKVLIWSFEKQDLNGGDPPIIDVYIDDGRGGEYAFLENFSDTATIWNRRAPDGIEGHQEPTLGPNYAYVKIKNRGTSMADHVVVRGFHCKPLAGRVWPGDFQPMTTPELSAGTLQPNNAEELTVGPFEWTPAPNADGHDSMLMIVSAPGDPSNADKFSAAEQIKDWRLIPNDNNVGLRNVKLQPRLVTIIADKGHFGNVCAGSHKDMTLVLSNSGFNMLSITNIKSSTGEFLVPSVLTFPIAIDSGDSIEIPIRFQPTDFGFSSAVITVTSNNPTGQKKISVSGNAPSGTLKVTGSTCIGGVKAGCIGERTIAICNTGKCALHVKSAGLSRRSKHWKLVHNPFPATLNPGACLSLLIRYKATEKCPRSMQLVIKSDDPETSVKILDLMAYTATTGCGCAKPNDCKDPGCGDPCGPDCCVQCLDSCCFDEECDDKGHDEH